MVLVEPHGPEIPGPHLEHGTPDPQLLHPLQQGTEEGGADPPAPLPRGDGQAQDAEEGL